MTIWGLIEYQSFYGSWPCADSFFASMLHSYTTTWFCSPLLKFEPNKVPHGSSIQAKYVLKGLHTGMTFFIFVDEEEQRWLCRSISQLNIADYTINQTRVTVLKKKKLKNGTVTINYIHPNYKPRELNNLTKTSKELTECCFLYEGADLLVGSHFFARKKKRVGQKHNFPPTLSK